MTIRTLGLLCLYGIASTLAACGSHTPAPIVYGSQGSTSQPFSYTDSTRKHESPKSISVRRGDTLYSLARSHGFTVDQLKAQNGLKAPFTLQIGQKLILPTDPVHTVASGETLHRISRRYGAEPEVVAEFNRIEPPYRVAAGQKITIPTTSATGSIAPLSPPPSAAVQTAPLTTRLSPPPSEVITTAHLSPPPPIPRMKKEKTFPAPQASSAQRLPIPTPPPQRTSRFIWPVKGKVISSFGPKGDGLHNDGINISAPAGTPVVAADGGRVSYVGNELKGYGNLILIHHADGFVTAYAHNSQYAVQRGETVKKGQTIGYVGKSGSVSSPQLHFEVRRGKTAVNPKKYLGSSQKYATR